MNYKMEKTKKFKIILLIFISIFLIFYFLIFKTNLFKFATSLISYENKTIIKKYFFPYQYNSQLEDLIKMLNDQIENEKKYYSRVKEELQESNKLLSNIPNILGQSTLNLISKKDINFDNTNYELNIFKNDYVRIKKASDAKSGSLYIDKYKNDIIYVTADGYFQYFSKNFLGNKDIKSKIINSNIKNIILYSEFYEDSQYGIKDLYIYRDNIFISFIRKINKNCYNTSILKAKFDYEFLNFEPFFFPEECIQSTIPSFHPHSSGGRMYANNDNMYFSTGEYLDRSKAQSMNSVFGKILKLNLNETNIKNYEIMSLGHRNVQGLYFDETNNFIISTEHGPQGGDEVNINFNLNKKDKPNFGWPISSYGEHYNFKERDDSSQAYKLAPLYKSHERYGFVEPLMYFTPSIAISQITKIPTINSEKNEDLFIFGSLGKDPEEGDMSLHFIKFDKKNKKITKHNFFPVDNRVRDITSLDNDTILLTLETNGTIGILKKK